MRARASNGTGRPDRVRRSSAMSVPACAVRADVVRDGRSIRARSMVIDGAAWLVLVPIIVLGVAIWRAKA
jgi:hypothetical protein